MRLVLGIMLALLPLSNAYALSQELTTDAGTYYCQPVPQGVTLAGVEAFYTSKYPGTVISSSSGSPIIAITVRNPDGSYEPQAMFFTIDNVCEAVAEQQNNQAAAAAQSQDDGPSFDHEPTISGDGQVGGYQSP